MNQTNQCVIFSAGRGSRLAKYTKERPKTMIPLYGEVSILEHALLQLPPQITHVVLVVNYLADVIREKIQDNHNGKSITYAYQDTRNGTWGALIAAKKYLSTGEDFLVFGGDDIYMREDFLKLLAVKHGFGVSRHVMPPEYYSMVSGPSGTISGFRKQSEQEKKQGAIVATGAYHLDMKVYDFSPIAIAGAEYGLPQTLLANKEEYPMHVCHLNNWMPINTEEQLLCAREHFSNY